MNIINYIKNKIIGDKIFAHEASGETCCVCGKPMYTNQRITMVGSGEKMHQSCWPKFFSTGVSNLSKNNDR